MPRDSRFIIVLLAILIGFIVVYNFLPSQAPDTIAYDVASKYGIKSKLIIVDFSKNSCRNRMYVYDIANRKLLYLCKVLNGKGGNHKFSNTIGSNCSSLGLYRISAHSKLNNGYPCLRLDGLQTSNSNARRRGIVVHPSVLASSLPFELPCLNFPLTNASLGCFSVSYHSYSKIKTLVKPGDYIYAYY